MMPFCIVKERKSMKLTKEEFDNELSYLVSKHLLDDLLNKGYINQEEYTSIKKELLNHYHPIISGLLEGVDICAWK